MNIRTLFSCFLCLAPTCFAARPAFSQIGSVTLNSPSGLISDIIVSAGEIYALDARAMTVTHFNGQGSLVRQFALSGIPESGQGHVTLQPEIAADAAGNVYAVGILRNSARETFTSIFVFDSQGRFVRSVPMSPRAEARHLAIDRNGNFYILGMDPAFFKWSVDLCLLVHKYDPQGRRVTAFSACPANLRLRTPQSAVPGPDFAQLNRETNLGKVWISGDILYHSLPASHIVRTFNLNGKQLSEITLDTAAAGVTLPPDPTAAVADNIRRVMPVANGGFLVEWSHVEQTGGNRRAVRSLCLYDAAGRKLTDPVIPDPGTAVLFSDENGICYMLHRRDSANPSYDLLRTSVAAH